MTAAVVYHWWSEKSDRPPYANQRSPIVASIASLRAHHPYIKIYVLDGSEQECDWKHFPEKLKFEVIKQRHGLSGYQYRPGWKHLSRLFDISDFMSNMSEDMLVYQDSDVFWLKNMWPLSGNPDKFCFDTNNSGFFYHNTKSDMVRRFYDIFKAYCITALNDDSFRYLTRQYIDYNEWYYLPDETILHYMWHKHRDMFCAIPATEHMLARNIDTVEGKGSMLHFNGISVRNELVKEEWLANHSRGIVGLLVKEVREALNSVLNQEDLDLMYSREEQDFYKPEISLTDKDFIQRLLYTKDETNHYDLLKANKNVLPPT